MVGDRTVIKKTGKEIKVLMSHCSFCNMKKSMSVTVNTKAAEDLGDFFKNLCKKGPYISKMMAKMS